jgi:predicted RNase H-like nuclease (RuvC/YqgF family)
MTDLGIQQAAIKKLEAENKKLKAQNNHYAIRICQQEDKISEQQITIEHLTASENELLGDLAALRTLTSELDKEVDQLLKIVAPKHFLNFVDEKELKTTESN